MEDLGEEVRAELRGLFEGLSGGKGDRVQDAGDGDDDGSRYGALQARIDELFGDAAEGSDAFYRLLAMRNSIVYEEAKGRMLRDDTVVSEELLEKTLNEIHGHREHPQVVFLHLRVVNHLAYILSKKGELQKAQQLLEEVSKPMGDDEEKLVLVYR